MTYERNRILLPAMLFRAGTSKGVYLLERDMPADRAAWDALLLHLMGSPSKTQIDGLGGAQSVTSKVAIVQPSARPNADVDYTFAQVSVDQSLVSYKGNCGNILSGVGPFAIERGLVQPQDGITAVHIYNTNTDKYITADVPVKNGQVVYDGDYAIAGVPGTAAPIRLQFLHPAGTLGRGLLPTGNAADVLHIPGFGSVTVSIVDAANPLVFVRAAELGLTGREVPADINGDPHMLHLLEAVRGMAAVRLGLLSDYSRAASEMPGIPKMTFVAEPDDYTAADGHTVSGGSIDLLSRMMSMQKAHPSYAMTGAMCTAAAAVIPGSVVQQVIRENFDTQCIRIGHAGGVLECGVTYTQAGDAPDIQTAFGFRTANLLMDGVARVRP